MSLYHRALVHYGRASEAEAIDDLKEELEMPDSSEHIKAEARRKLARMERSMHRADAAEPVDESHSQGGKHARTEPKAAGKHID